MSEQSNIVVVAAKRSAIGNFNGSLSSKPAHEIGAEVVKKILEETSVAANDISELISGQVLTANQGQNPARQTSINAGLPVETPAWTINQVCGSGLRSVALAAQSINAGLGNVVIAGGQENMSLAPHAATLRNGYKMGSAEFTDTMIKDGLTDIFNNYHMGITAENISEKYSINRDVQDNFALQSQLKAEAAIKAGKFRDEIVPITVVERRQERVFDSDEFVKMASTIDMFSNLRPAFKKDGTITAGNASGINDGAAFVMLMTEAEANKRGLKPLARIKSFAQAGVDPKLMGTGPIPASKLALKKAGWDVNDLELVEANEAFAAQAVCVNNGMEWNQEIVNVNGGSIALGHPIGASGTRIIVTLLHEMQKRDAKKALATLCVGGGMGVAMCFERD